MTGPSIALSHTRLDLGEGRPGEQLEGSFTVSNRGSEPLEFKLSASCGCAFVRPMAGTLAPAQSQTITLGIRLPATINSEKSAQILIRSNDPHQPQVGCTATARAPAPWEVSPTHVNFGYVLHEELRRRPRRRLVVRPGQGKHALPTSAVRVQTPGEAYRVRSHASPDGTLAIDISLRPGLADGRYTSTLHLGHAEDPALISIPLDAEVGPAIALVPATVYLARDRASGVYRPAPLMAVARQRGLAIGDLTPVNWPEGVHLRQPTPQSGRVRRYLIHFEPAAQVPAAGLRLELQAEPLGERLQVVLLAEADGLHSAPLPAQPNLTREN